MKKIIMVLLGIICASHAMDRNPSSLLTGHKRTRQFDEENEEFRERLRDASILMSLIPTDSESSDSSYDSDEDKEISSHDRAHQEPCVEVTVTPPLPLTSDLEVLPTAQQAPKRMDLWKQLKLLKNYLQEYSFTSQISVIPCPIFVNYRCFKCEAQFKSHEELRRHLFDQHHEIRFICKCGGVFVRQGSLDTHFKHCSITWENAVPARINIKGRRFRQPKEHLENICPACGKSFTAAYFLEDHILGVHCRPRFACKCGIEHANFTELKAHRKVCDKCR